MRFKYEFVYFVYKFDLTLINTAQHMAKNISKTMRLQNMHVGLNEKFRVIH